MTKVQFLNLYQYEFWSNEKMIQTLLSLEAIPEKVPSVFSHMLNAQIIWLSRLRQETATRAVWDNIPAENWLSELESHTKGFQAYIESLHETDLDTLVIYKNSKGDSFETSIRDILSHVLIHSSYHRGQMIAWIRPLLDTVPTFDYIFYLRE